MKRWRLLILLLALTLCACGGKEPERETEIPAPEDRQASRWSGLDWNSRLELEYAQSFAVDFAEGGYARITIDQETYLLCPEGLDPPADTPEDVVVLR